MYNPDIELEIVPYGVVYPFTDTVLVNSYSLQMGTTSKMTADVKGPATISYITSKETESTISVNFSADIQSRIFNSLAFKFGVSYTQTSSTGASFQIPSGKLVQYISHLVCIQVHVHMLTKMVLLHQSM